MTLLPLLDLATRADGADDGSASALFLFLKFANVPPGLPLLLALLVGAVLIKALLSLLAAKEVGYAVAGVMTDLRVRMLQNIAHARWPYLASLESGRLANAVGIEALRAANVFNAIAQLFALCVQVLVYGIAVALIAWNVAVAGLVCSGIAAFLFRGFVSRLREASIAQTEMIKLVSNQLTQLVLSMKPVKAMAVEDNYVGTLYRRFDRLNEASRRQIMSVESVRLMQEPMAVGILAIGLYIFVEHVGVPMSAMMVTALLFYRLLSRLGAIQQTYQVVVSGESAFWSLQDLTQGAATEKELDDGPRHNVVFRRNIELQNIVFCYGEKQVLRGAGFAVGFGEYVCLRGESGAGKSTLGDIVMRLISPKSGMINVDGIPLHDVDLTCWRKQLSYVPQEPALFAGSILENVTMGDPTYTRDDVKKSLADAGAWGFVESLPNGMDTELGDRGHGLSGGQRQRLAIARALIRNPKLLILDEVTASLDPGSEEEVMATLRVLRGKVTILAISHQPAVAEAADRVLLVENGMVAEIK